MLRKWIVLPLKEKSLIDERLEILCTFCDDSDLTDDIIKHLKQISDLERLISKVAVGRINPRELLQLKRAIINTIPIKRALEKKSIPEIKKLASQIDVCEFVKEKIERELKDEVPLTTNQGGIINEGVSEELDELRKIAFSGKDFLLQIQQTESKRTGISSLKIAYNKVFGYYLEVTNVHKNKVPDDWIRKQTLVNAERYITEELKVYEEKILNAEEKINEIEQKLYFELVRNIADFTVQIQQNARILAKIDCLSSLAIETPS